DVSRGHPARPAHRGALGRRLPRPPRSRPDAHDRDPDRDHHRGQRAPHPAHRDHRALPQLRGVVHPGQRRRGRVAAGLLGTGSRAVKGPARPGFDASPPIGRTVVRLGLALILLYTGLGIGIGYWQVFDAEALTTDPLDPLVVQEREAPRGNIVDARGVVLASTVDGQRHYRDV